MNRRIFLTLLLVTLASAGIVFQLRANREAAQNEIRQETTDRPLLVRVQPFGVQPFVGRIATVGTVAAWQTVQVAAETDGRATQVLIQTGDRVRPGQLLVALDADLKTAAHDLNQSTAAKARRDLARYTALAAEHNATPVDVENARLQLETAEAQLRISAKQLSNARIVAPIGGIITERPVTVGAFLSPTAPVVTITELARVKVRCELPEREVVRVKVGDAARVTVDAFSGRTFRGTVRAVIPQPTQARMFPVEIEMANQPDAELLPGMSATVTLHENDQQAVPAIPRTAVVGDLARPRAYIVNTQNVVEARSLHLGRAFGQWLEVTAGLQPGDRVLVTGQQQAEVGRKVAVAQ